MKLYCFAAIIRTASAVHSTAPPMAPSRSKTRLIQPDAGPGWPLAAARCVWCSKSIGRSRPSSRAAATTAPGLVLCQLDRPSDGRVRSSPAGISKLDSTPADVICADGRYSLNGVLDVYSRRARVLVRPTSRATAIVAALRRALLDRSVSEIVRTDEGKDYVSRHVRRVLADLGIEHDILPPYSPESKPFIEHFFGTLARGCLAYLPGFAGHNVTQRQAIRARRSFAARRGESAADAYRVKLAAADLQERIDAWIETVYEREPHGGLDGRAPFEAAAG